LATYEPTVSREASNAEIRAHSSGEEAGVLESLPLAAFLIDSNLRLSGANRVFWEMIAVDRDRDNFSFADLEGILNANLTSVCHRLLESDESPQAMISAGNSVPGLSPLMICLARSEHLSAKGLLGLLIRTENGSLPEVHDSDADNTGLSHLSHQLAHELRNPCTIIGGFAALLKRNLNSADKLSEYARIIMEEVQRVEKTLDDVLDFSKSLLETRAMIDLNELITEAVTTGEKSVFAASEAFEMCRSEHVLPALVNREQAIRSLRDILTVLRSTLSGDVGIRLGLKESGRHNCIEIGFTVEESDRVRLEQQLASLFSSGSRATGLRLTLAIESIRHSGGEFELIGTSSSGTRVCIAYPATEETYA
jgi:signal transduction histidine kinase